MLLKKEDDVYKRDYTWWGPQIIFFSEREIGLYFYFKQQYHGKSLFFHKNGQDGWYNFKETYQGRMACLFENKLIIKYILNDK